MRQKLLRHLFRPRFSLKVLLVLAAVVGIASLPFVQRLNQARQQKALVAELRLQKVKVTTTTSPQNHVLRMLGSDIFDEVVCVNCSAKIEQSLLDRMQCLASLQVLYLDGGGDVLELKALGNLKRLEFLYLVDARLPDFYPLATTTTFTKLILVGTVVDNWNSISCLSGLVYLDIHLADVTDLSPLHDLKSLKRLWLPEAASKEEVLRLKAARQGLTVYPHDFF